MTAYDASGDLVTGSANTGTFSRAPLLFPQTWHTALFLQGQGEPHLLEQTKVHAKLNPLS